MIQIKATSPCRDELLWEAKFPQLFPPGRERVPGTEGAGVVVKVPVEGSSFKPGDEVYFRQPASERGCLSDYTYVNTEYLALKPNSMNWIEAAATPLSALTAYQALFEQGVLNQAAINPLKSEDYEIARQQNQMIRLLITAAGGSVGRWAVQLAAAAGAGFILAISGPSNVKQVKAAGATEVLDYTKQSVRSWVKEDDDRLCDMVFDCVSADLEGYWAALQPGGTLISVAGDHKRP